MKLSKILYQARRRHVFRVAGLYIVGAWLLLQIAALTFPAFTIPDQSIRYVWIAVILGFPAALVFGWRFDFRDGRVVRTSDDDDQAPMELQRPDYLILAALAVVLALIITGSLSEISETQNTPAESQLSIQIDPASIAVLPFVAVSSSPDDQYLAHGISETLIHQLAQVSDLRVIARTSSFSFIDTPNLDARSIGQSLGVASVLEGSVQRIGGKLRILTQMVNTETGTHVWSEQFDRDESDIFEIQDDIAKFVVEHLRQTIKTEASELPIGDVGTSNLEAYDEYLRGLDQLRLGSVESLPEAILHFNRAIDLDETFNQARLKLLETYRVQLKVGQIDYAELLVRNQTIPHEILKFEPDSAGALNYLAAADFSIYFPTGSGEAERLWARALDIAPRDPIILTHYAYYLSWNDKPNEAIANLELALEVDPYSSWTLGEAALNGSTQYADQLLQKYPDNPSGWDITAYLQLIRGDLVEAYRSYRQAERLSPYNHEFTTSIATVLMTAGLLEEAETELREAEAKGPGQISTISARIGLEYLKGNLDSAGQMALNALRNQLPPRMMGPIITQNIALQYALSSDQPLDYVDAIALWTGVPGMGGRKDLRSPAINAPPRWSWQLKTVPAFRAAGEPAVADGILTAARIFFDEASERFREGETEFELFLYEGRHDEALDVLESLIDRGVGGYLPGTNPSELRWWLEFDTPLSGSLRENPRFGEIVKKREAHIAVQRDAILLLRADEVKDQFSYRQN